MQSAAEMGIWTRRRETTREDVRRALWQTRELVKTSAMRLTLHVIPAADLAVYVEAMRPTSSAVLARWQGR
ncbi:MAG: winged helix DNA-binding domain-containing protein, partial [Acidobacteria bacterium]|nr:winged helix DNA-binding domain-containing protein [Acidobacteriota bacterium]